MGDIDEEIFRKEPFFYGHNNYDQLAKIAKVLGTYELNAYLNKYRIELDHHLAALDGRHSRKPLMKFINSDNQHIAVPEAIDIVDKLLKDDQQDRPTAKEAVLLKSSYVTRYSIILHSGTPSSSSTFLEVLHDGKDTWAIATR